MGLDFVKIWKFQFVSRITLKTSGTSDLELQRYIVSGSELLHIGIFIHPLLTLTELWALIFVKIWNVQFVSRITLKPLVY